MFAQGSGVSGQGKPGMGRDTGSHGPHRFLKHARDCSRSDGTSSTDAFPRGLRPLLARRRAAVYALTNRATHRE